MVDIVSHCEFILLLEMRIQKGKALHSCNISRKSLGSHYFVPKRDEKLRQAQSSVLLSRVFGGISSIKNQLFVNLYRFHYC